MMEVNEEREDYQGRGVSQQGLGGWILQAEYIVMKGLVLKIQRIRRSKIWMDLMGVQQ